VKAVPFSGAVVGALHLVEGAKDFVLELLGDADAAVLDRDPQHLLPDDGLEADFSRGRRELDGIGEEVVEDLLELVLVRNQKRIKRLDAGGDLDLLLHRQ
jgi:hypothetical protein